MATTKYIDIRMRTKQAEARADKLDGKMRKLGDTTDRTTSEFGKLSKIASAIGTSLVVAQVTKYADSYTSLQNQIRQTTKSTSELATRTKDLLEISNRSRAGLSTTAELYTNLVLSTENLNLSTAEQLRLTETITKSFAVSGKSAAESAGAITQLGQAFASGALRGDEFNSIAEGAPEIMRALQRSLNLTQGELRTLAATGAITADVLVKALSGAASVIDDKFNASTATLAQNMEVANNNLTDFIGSSTTVQNVVGGLGGVLVAASESIGTIASSSAVLASLFAARLIPSMISYTSSVVANTTAQLTNGTAATRTANIYGVVSVAAAKATVSTNSLTLASRLLSGSMAFLGGPLGIALIAATALFAFRDEIFKTGERAELSAPQIDKLSSSIASMSREAKTATLANINKEMQDIREKIIETTNSLNSLGVQNSGALFDKSTIDAARYKKIIKDLTDQLDLLSQKQGIIIGTPDLSGGTDRGNINDPQDDKPAGQSKFALALAQDTQALQIQLELRQQAERGFLTQKDADLSAAFINDSIKRATAFEEELLKLGENEEAKTLLTDQLKENQLLREQEFQAQITGITLTETDKRIAIAEAAAAAEDKLKSSVTQNAIGLLQVLGRENKAAAIAGIVIAKAVALSANAAATASASTLAYASQLIPGDPTSIVRATAAAAKATSLGSINAGLIVATGLGQTAGVLSGGSGATGVTNAGTGSFQGQQSTQQPPPTSIRTVDIRTDGSAFSEAVKDAALVLFNGGDDDIVLNITNAQSELVRTGVIA